MPEFVESMQAAGIQTLRRSLMDVRMERGTLDGKFGSLIVSAGNLAQDELDSSDAIWAHMKNGTI
mgnify:CR=1 FL=1